MVPIGMLDLKYVRPENLHVTLKFLGNVADERVPELTRALEAMPTGPLGPVFADRPEHLPPRGPVRVVAVGLAGDAGGVRRLFRVIDGCCGEFGVAAEKRDFWAHVTLARARDPLHTSDREHLADLLALDLPGPPFQPTQFTLFRSELKPAGPEYTPLARFPAAASPAPLGEVKDRRPESS